MPYDKDKNGESIFLTPYQYRIKHERFVDPETGEIDEHKFDDGSWKPGWHPNSRKGVFTTDNNPRTGRAKGSKNKKTLQAEAKAKGYMTGYELLSEILNDETVNLNQRMSAAKEIAKYETPALSSIEVHTDEEHVSPFTITLAPTKEAKDVVDKATTKEKDNDDTDDK